MSVEVRVPAVLRPAMGGQATVDAQGSTIREVLTSLTSTYPSVAGQLLDADGDLHRFLNVYLNDDDVRYVGGLDAPVADGDEVTLLPAVAGGSGVTRVSSVLELIGRTPVVDVSELSPRADVSILVKLEGRNPAGSVKDRVALAMVEAAEAEGRLVPGAPGQTLLEPSSGNTGIALAMVCRLRGYSLKVVLPTSVSPERRQLLLSWGAEIIDSPGSEGSNGAVRLGRRLAEENPDWVFLYQYANEANPMAHYRTTGPEILADVPEVTHLVAGLGTSGTLLGAGRFLKEHVPGLQVWAVEPPAGEVVDGLRSLEDGYVPPIFTSNHGAELLDRKVVVRPKESIEWTRRLMEVGLFVGLSSGAAMAGAVRCAGSLGEDERATIVTVAADEGWKYLSTGAWTDDLDEVIERAKSTIYF